MIDIENLGRRLETRRILVTGGGTGIGRATCRRLAAEGAAVAVADIRLAEAEATVALIAERGGTAIAVEHDVTDEAQTAAIVARVVDEFGGLDGLHANAGITTFSRLHELTLDDWHRVIGVNLTGVFLSVKHTIPAMIAAGGGSIVVTGSASSVVNGLGGSAVSYKASKGGVLSIVRAVATEYADDGIRANCVCPGLISTEIVGHAIEEMATTTSLRTPWRASAKVRPPIARAGEPEEIAAAVAYLLSDDASFVTGIALLVDGGLTSI